MRWFLVLAGLACYLTFGAAGAWAQTQPVLDVRGFGSLTATRTDEPTIGYRGYPQPLSLATSTNWNLKPDSLVGLQLDWGASEPLSGTVQVISRYRETGALNTQVEWAFLKYQIDSAWRVRLGRLLTPVFMDSEYRFAHYALTPVRTDLNVYILHIFQNHDGADLTYRTPFSGGTLGLSVFGGSSQFNLSPEQNLEIPETYGITASWENGNWRVHAGVTNFVARVTDSTSGSVRGLRTALLAAAPLGCPQCLEASRVVDALLEGVGLRIWSVGFRHTHGDTQVWGEFARQQWRQYAPYYSVESSTLGVAHSFGDWTPYVTLATARAPFANSVSIPPDQIAAVPSRALQSALMGYQATLVPTDNSRNTLALGVRWDLAADQALKLELLHMQLLNPQGYPYFFPKVPGSGQSKQEFNLISASWDFVF